MAAYRRGFMSHITCRLTAKNRDQLRYPTLGNRVWATFFILHVVCLYICRHNYAVERGLVLRFCGQPHYCYRLCTIRQPGFDLLRHTWSLMNRFRTGQCRCRANLHKWGLAQSPCCDCGQRQTMDHIVRHVPSNKIWRRTESTARSG